MPLIEPTAGYVPEEESATGTGSVGQRQPHVPLFDEETRILLWWRLLLNHAVNLIVHLSMGALIASGLLVAWPIDLPPWLFLLPVIIIVQNATGIVSLWLRPGTSLRGLRWLEVLNFGVIVVAGGLDKYVRLALEPAAEDNAYSAYGFGHVAPPHDTLAKCRSLHCDP